MGRRRKAKTFRLNIAGGQAGQPPEGNGYTNIDLWEGADLVHDLNVYPWPVDDDCVEHVWCSHYCEHIPMTLPDGSNGWFRFFDELHRVMKDGAEARFLYPHNRSDRAFQDPTHTRFIPESTWAYLNREWREQNKLDHYPARADFEIQQIFYSGFHGDWHLREESARQFALTHYWNVAMDVVVDLKCVKPVEPTGETPTIPGNG